MWATPVIRVNYSGISGEGQESARNLPFPGVTWRTAMPQLQTFPTSNLYSHFRPIGDVYYILVNAKSILLNGHSYKTCDQ